MRKIRDQSDVIIIMVFMARFLFNQWYACSGGKHLVDYVFFQSEPSTCSDIHIPERVTSRSAPFQLHTITISSSIGTRNVHNFSITSPSACLWTILFFLFAVGGSFPPTFAEVLLSILYSVGLRIKIRHLSWQIYEKPCNLQLLAIVDEKLYNCTS